jgi:hypothetical protein
MDGAEARQILPDLSNAGIVAPPPGRNSGQVLFVRNGTLMALPFDMKRLEAAGDAFPAQANTSWWVSNSINRRPAKSWNDPAYIYPARFPVKARMPSESAARQAMLRSRSVPSKYPTSTVRKYIPGSKLNRPNGPA